MDTARKIIYNSNSIDQYHDQWKQQTLADKLNELYIMQCDTTRKWRLLEVTKMNDHPHMLAKHIEDSIIMNQLNIVSMYQYPGDDHEILTAGSVGMLADNQVYTYKVMKVPNGINKRKFIDMLDL